MGHKVLVVARTIILVYAVLLVMMAGCQRRFIYYPERAPMGDLLDLARGAGLEPWRDHDDELVGWRTPAVDENRIKNTLVVFHGNAGYALHRTYFARGFESIPDARDWQVYIFEYPGYGARPGRPSEGTIKQSAEEAIHLLRKAGLRVFLIGESLGGGVACYLAGKHPGEIAGLFLVTPFTSLVDVGRHHYPILPVGLLLRERYDNSRALKEYRGPVAFLVAGRDEVIPARLGLRLHDEYQGPRKLIVQQDRTHNTLIYQPRAPWWREVAEFLLAGGMAAGGCG